MVAATTGLEEIEEALYKCILEWTEPDPDGNFDANGKLWTGTSRLEQEAIKDNVPCDREGVRIALDRLAKQDRIVRWHGLIAPATIEHLTAIIENETSVESVRSTLVGACNQAIAANRSDDE